MKLWMAYTTLAISIMFIVLLALVGCSRPDRISVTNNGNGNNVGIGTNGGAGGAGTCPAPGTSRNPSNSGASSGGTGSVNPSPNCSTTNNTAAPVLELKTAGAPSLTGLDLAEVLK
jgi:hypothetical protein